MGGAITANVIGLGYVGTVTCIHLASLGHQVSGWDKDADRVHCFRTGSIPYQDADLLACKSVLSSSNARFHELPNDLPPAALWVICVGTPTDPRSGQLDATDVTRAFKTVLERCVSMQQWSPCITIRSTLPPSTYREHLKPLLEEAKSRNPAFRPRYLYLPEFLREGAAIEDSRNPAMVAMGCEPDASSEDLELIQRAFGVAPGKIFPISIGAAEILKSTCNAFHALKVTFANEISRLSQSFGVDGIEVMSSFIQDRKLNLSSAYLRPGFAYGGPCLEKDLQGLCQAARSQDLHLPLLESISTSNQKHLERTAASILLWTQRAESITVLGAAFKAGSTDTRSSPVLSLLKRIEPGLSGKTITFLREPGLSPEFLKEHFSVIKIRTSDEFSAAIQRSEAIIVGAYGLSSAQNQLLLDFQGPLIDLMMNGKTTATIQSLPNYLRVC